MELSQPVFFKDVSELISHTHHEEEFDDYARQPLLPYKLSQLGPGVAWFDLDGNGHDDLIIGSGRGGQLAAYRNNGGEFRRIAGAPFDAPVTRDQTTVLGWRQPGGQAVVLVGSANYEDGLAVGGAVRQYDLAQKVAYESFPGHPSSTGPMSLADMDGDGNLDLFVGGRVIPGRWPEAASSRIYRHDGRQWRLDAENSRLLEKVAGRKTELFRAPYGARNHDILERVNSEGLRSVMWSIDSLDWADPIPESIAMRVLHELNQKHKGIILFHDIHKQSVLALSPVVEELQRQDYTFLAYEGGKFAKTAAPATTDRATPAVTETAAPPASTPATPGKKSFYRQSWAIIIGVNEYESWPKLKYAVNDANGIEDSLVNKFGFQKDHIRKLLNGEASRQRIMQVLGDEFTDGGKVNREDRVFFFFAGHGATRTLGDGRQIGVIVPADADRENYYSTAISMTQLRDAADLIPAKHIYFVMDSCYSGLALSRGSGAYSKDRTYLEEVTRRAARQILTAGGADQQVADDGPGGHSVFTWALLQGLDGKADLDGNSVITASELGAYVSPIVASFSKQTPTVGNMVGSEGGEFLFELQPESLTSQSQQMDGKGIKLNQELDTLEKQIAAKQAELLKLQQSVQAESTRLAQMTHGGNAVAATRAAAVKPPRAYDLDREARQLYREKRYDEALKKFQAAVALKPKDPVLLNNLGFLYYTMGLDEESLRWLEKTVDLDPKRKEAHINLAELLQRMGRNSEAKLHYEEYLKLYPASPKADEFRRIIQTL
jgi:uncharacterized caspase-like protein